MALQAHNKFDFLHIYCYLSTIVTNTYHIISEQFCQFLVNLLSMVHAFITSHLDYCNSLLCGLPTNQIKTLQAIQNTAAHLVTNLNKYDHITPMLKGLHWLPVQQQINFKILLFKFKCLPGQAPKYLQNLLKWSQPKGLRSDNNLLLVVHKSQQLTYGDPACSIAATRSWNTLPNYIKLCQYKVFKCHLQSHLFKGSYM